MKVRFFQPNLDYLRHGYEIDKAIKRVLTNGELVLGFGPEIEEFEKKFAAFIGTKYAIMCGAGTQALYLAYRALGIGKGDEVITVSHTFAATIDQIVALGAKPVLVDIGEDGLIDPEGIVKAITPKTKAIVPVHLEGKVCEMSLINEIALHHKLIVIEDAAQAIGAEIHGVKAGNWGKAGCFSFFPAKILGAIGNAGAVTTNDPELAERLRMMRCNWNLGKNPDIKNAEWGTNMEPDNIQAAVLSLRINCLSEVIARRQKIAEEYDEGLKDLPIKLPLKQRGRVYQDYVIRPIWKEKLVPYLKEKEIGILGHDLIPNHHYKKLKLKFYLPRTDEYIQEQIRIPCNPNLTYEEVNYIIETLKAFYV